MAYPVLLFSFLSGLAAFAYGAVPEPCFDATARFRDHFADCQRKAEQGDVLAQYNVAVMYDRGLEIPQDPEKARQWYTKAAHQGDREAQASLGWIYFSASLPGIDSDYAKAAYWYRLAANQGSADAEYMLGWIFQEGGNGLDKNDRLAVHWYTRAARHGQVTAQTGLGLMVYQGKGIAQDRFKAYLIFSLAASNGDPGAKELKTLIGKELSAVKIRQATEIIKRCLGKTAVAANCGLFE